MDHDGHDDVLVGAPGNAAAGKDAGRAYLYSGKDGRKLMTWTGEREGDAFGSTVAGYTPRQASRSSWSAPPPPARRRPGASTCTTALSPKPRFVLESDETGGALGYMFMSIPGDLDGDGVPDLYATDFANTAKGPSTGRAYAWSGKTGKNLLTLTGETQGEGFGIGPGPAGDVDGDGRPDLVMGAWQYAGAAVSGGRTYLYSGKDGKLLKTYTCRIPGDTFGFDAVGMGDTDGDGTVDLLITSAWSGIKGNHSGRVCSSRAACRRRLREARRPRRPRPRAHDLVRPPPAEKPAGDRYEQTLQPLLEDFVRRQEIPGLAIAVIDDGRIVYEHGFGVLSLKTPDPVTPRSLFHMASITKPFVATAVMQLVEKGRIRLDAPIATYLPYFKMADPRAATITIEQLLTHTSGMPDVDDYEWDKPQYDDGALERYVRSIANLQLVFGPGERFQYSNMAYEILGDVVAKASGMTFEEYVRRNILEPLAMSDSTLLVTEAAPALMTWGHELDEHGKPIPSKVYPYNRMHTPSSDLHSNVRDMSRWAIANLDGGELDGKRILEKSTRERMWKEAREIASPGPDVRRQAIGLSWFLGQHRGRKIVSHGGGDTGYLTDLVLVPEGRKAVVWMMNVDFLDPAPITRAALDVVLGLEPQPITSKRSAGRMLDCHLPERRTRCGAQAARRAQGDPGRRLRPRRRRAQYARLFPAGRETHRRSPARFPAERRGVPEVRQRPGQPRRGIRGGRQHRSRPGGLRASPEAGPRVHPPRARLAEEASARAVECGLPSCATGGTARPCGRLVPAL